MTSTELREITRNLRAISEETFPFRSKWHYKHDPTIATPYQFIELYCKSIPVFTYEELFSKESSLPNDFRFTQSDQLLLQYLIDHQTARVIFNPFRLVKYFSLDSYWIQIPNNIHENNLQILLGYLPSAHIITTEKNKYLWAPLTPEIVHWFVSDLKWTVQPVNLNYRKTLFELNWYNPQTLNWRIPHLLKSDS